MRRNMSGNLGLDKYLWPGSVYLFKKITYTIHIRNTYDDTNYETKFFFVKFCARQNNLVTLGAHF